MKFLRALTLLLGLASLTGCAGLAAEGLIDELRQARPVGSPFTQRLAEEYLKLAEFEGYQMYDWEDSEHFARKGLRAANGEAVLPEDLKNWKLPEGRLPELTESRIRLIQQLSAGARAQVPVEAAVAQARFDCWVEQQEENFQVDDIATCRGDFLSAIGALEQAMVPPPAPEPPPPPPAEQPVFAPKDSTFLIFFDFDRSNLTPTAQQTLDTVVGEGRRLGVGGYDVTGHADRAGPDRYNQALSERRARAAKEGLVARGVDPLQIILKGAGERQPLVQTRDGVREPANRRAEIRFQP